LLAVAVVAAAASGCSPQASPSIPPRPDIVLITVDALRADALSCAGNPQVETPHLDRLAADGVMFSQAISSFVGTTAAMPSLMTGRFPSFEDVSEWNEATFNGFCHLNSPGEAAGLTANVETLAEILGSQGYLCAGFNTNPNLAPRSRFNQGFDHYHGFGAYLAERNQNRRHPLVGQYPPADVVVDTVLEWLAHAPPEPIFVWFHLMDPHSPYLPPAPFDRLPHRSYTPATDLQINEALYKIVVAQYGPPPRSLQPALESLPGSPAESLEHLMALYEGEVRFADRELGRLFAGLRRLDRWQHAMVIVTADHGEEFFEHGHAIHHLLEPALEELIRIPLLVRLPAASPGGRRVDSLVRMVDIAPTVLDYVDGAVAPRAMDGTSLRPLIEGRTMPELTAFISAIDFGVARGERWKYRLVKAPFETHLPGESLFDIQADPLEARDVAAEHPQALAEMRRRYQDFVSHLRQRGAPPSATPITPSEVDPEVQQRLEALGYLDG
jgi:arylsulfatase A-like enzyme